MAPSNNVAATGIGTAVCRAIEAYEPPQTRICNDTLADELLYPSYRFLLKYKFIRAWVLSKFDEVTRLIYNIQICRTRFLDDAVENLLTQDFKQLIILGAGLDSRAYRLPVADKVKVFELDLPGMLQYKKKRVEKILGRLPENVHYLPIDFATQALESAFANSGFDPSEKTIFLWEGVTQYLAEESVKQTLAFIGKCKPGSVLLFTYVLRGMLEKRLPGSEQLMNLINKEKVQWVFGLEPSELAAFLKPFHLKLAEEAGVDLFHKNYIEPTGRKLTLVDAERIVQALVA